MKAKKLLCSTLAATLLLSAANVVTVYAENQSSEEYIAHSSMYALYSIDLQTGIVTDIPLAELWDTDILEVIASKNSGTLSFVVTSESGAFEDITVKSITPTEYGAYTMTMGELRNKISSDISLDDAQLKLTATGMYIPTHVRTADSENDIYDHWYEESEGVYLFNSKTISGAPAQPYCDYIIDRTEDYKDKYIVDVSFSLDIEGTAQTYQIDFFETDANVSDTFSNDDTFAGSLNQYGFEETCLRVESIEPDSTIKYYNFNYSYIDYAGEIDTSIEEDAKVNLVDSYVMPNSAVDDQYYGYDMSFLPEQAATITVTYENADSNLTLRTAKPNSELEKTAISGSGKMTFDISTSDMTMLRKDCLVLELDGTATITDVEAQLIPNAKLIEGEKVEINKEFDNWDNFLYFEAENFEAYNTDTALMLDIALSDAASDAAIQLRYGKTYMEQVSDVTTVTDGTSSFDITGYLDEIKKNGLYIYGSGVTIDTISIAQTEDAPQKVYKPEYSAATAEESTLAVKGPTAIDDKQFAAFPYIFCQPNNTFSLKTNTNDGKYSQRFVKIISEEDSNNASYASIILYNGQKYVKVKTETCSDTITIGNKQWPAPEGYVFVSATVTNIPDNQLLLYSDFILE